MKSGVVAGALNAIVGVASRASSQIVTLLLTLVAARYLTPTEFGIFSLAAIATTLIRTLLYCGAFEHLLKAKDASEEASECLAVNVLVVLVTSAVVAAGALIARAAGGPDLLTDLLLLLLPSNLIAAITGWQESLLLRTERIRHYYFATLAAEIVALGVAVALFVNGAGIWALAGQVYARNLIMMLLYFVIGKIIFSDRFSRAKLVEVLRWSLDRYWTVSLAFGSTYAADVLLGVFLSPAATGLYRASSRLVTAISDMICQPTKLIGLAIFSARAARGESFAEIWPGVFAIAALFGWAALAVLGAGAATFVPLVLGPQWAGAVPLVMILCVARAMNVLDAVTGTVLVVADQARQILRIQMVASGVLLVALTLTAQLGIVALTIAVAVVAMGTTGLLAVTAARQMPGSGAVLLANLPLVIIPVSATAAGAWFAHTMVESHPMPLLLQAAVIAAAGGLAWVAATALLHRSVRRLYAQIMLARQAD
jgi:O-antigen/teichoic acid export membrane protein